MGQSTKGLLKGRVTVEELMNLIKQKYDNTAKSYVDVEKYVLDGDMIKEKYGDSEDLLSWKGFIQFKYKEVQLCMFYSYSNFNFHENLDYYKSFGLTEMVKSETTYISFGYSDISVELVRDIVEQFGGWIDDNDCDDKAYYHVVKNADGCIQPVLYITMDEVYKKFGSTVVITDRKL